MKPITCLDAEEHSGDHITDVVSHYLGCIEFGQRQSFYESLTPDSQLLIKNELRRTQYLRHVLENSEDVVDQALISQVKESMAEWRKEHKDDVKETSRWREENGKTSGDTSRYNPNGERQSNFNKKYDPIKDFNAYVIQFNDTGGITEKGIHERGQPVFKGKYPNQKVSVEWLLRGEHNYLDKEKFKDENGKPSRVRYFHFPANNMQVCPTV